MKYPQLVSTQAVNAINDWLVPQLEILGVEAPLIYSRLVLSLLQSSVQLNDPLELNNLKAYLTDRRQNKKISFSDSETLKKFAAVQCLMDVVSADQEITVVANFIDELFEKINTIEHHETEKTDSSKSPDLASIDVEDLRKRYYLAFPALSKNMENSMQLSATNPKASTWSKGNISSCTSKALNHELGVKKKQKRRKHQGGQKPRNVNIRSGSLRGNCSPLWDVNFTESWEMGRDLIKEFIVMQNSLQKGITKENTMISEDNKNVQKKLKINFQGNYEETIDRNDTNISNEITCPISPEMMLNALPRDLINSKEIFMVDVPLIEMNTNANKNSLFETNNMVAGSCTPKSDQNDFALLEAKFNSNIEALWSDMKVPSKNKQINLQNFWSNYYNHRYNEKFEEDNAIYHTKNDITCGSNTNNYEFRIASSSIWSDNLTLSTDKESQNFFKHNPELISQKKNDHMENVDHLQTHKSDKWSECYFETPFVPLCLFDSDETLHNLIKNKTEEKQQFSNMNCISSCQPCGGQDFSYNEIVDTEKSFEFIQPNITLKNHSKRSGFVEISKNNNNKICLEKNVFQSNSQSHTPIAENENLLTSEKTHFRPIKQSYADGYEFDISNNFDDIEFQRSNSGFLLLDSEKYLEYKKHISRDRHYSNQSNDKQQKTKFTLKFRVKQIDKSCQTDDFLYEELYYDPNMKIIDKCNYEQMKEENFCKNETSMDQWSMSDLKKNCVDNKQHTLWGMCPTCSKVNKSIPASNSLKDEINFDADELMSDLKYMQNLYISNSSDENNEISEVINEDLANHSNGDNQDQILYNISKLITDLLKPENAKSLADVLNNQGKNILKNVCSDDILSVNKKLLLNIDDGIENMKTINNSEQYIGGLWSNDEHIIWSHMNSSSTSLLNKLNWKYSNLSEIWNNASEKINTCSTLNSINTKLNDSKLCTKSVKNIISRNISQQVNHLSDTEHFKSKTIKRFDRKRRHSTSQNVNLINNIYDHLVLNNKFERIDDYRTDQNSTIPTEKDSSATIITCKYWTTWDACSLSPVYINCKNGYDGVNTRILDPHSILNHVSLSSRPLTR